MRQLRNRAQEIDAEIERGGFGRPVFQAAQAQLRDYDTAIADAESQVDSLQRQLDRGDLGRRDAQRAEREIDEYRRTIMETEDAARDLRQEFQSGDFGEATHNAARRAAERHREEMDRLHGRVRANAGGFNRLKGIGVGALGAITGAAAGVGAVFLGVNRLLDGANQRLDELQRNALRTGIEIRQQLQIRRAFAGLGFDPDEGTESVGEAIDELRRRVGEFQTEGTGQLVDVGALGVDIGALADLQGVDRYIAALGEIRRVQQEVGDDQAGILADNLFGGAEAQIAFQVATRGSTDDYNRFIEELTNGQVPTQQTIDQANRLRGDGALLGETFGNLNLIVSSLLGPTFGFFSRTIGNIADRVGPWIEDNRELATVIGGVLFGSIIAISIAIGVLSVAFIAGAASASPLIAAGIASSLAWAPWLALALGIIVVIGLITAAVIWMVRNWNRVTDFFDRHWPRIALAVGIILPPIGLVIAAVGFLRENWDEISAFFGDSWQAVKGFFQDGADFVELQVNRVLGFARRMADVIHRLTGGLIDLRDNIPGDISIGGDGGGAPGPRPGGAPGGGDAPGAPSRRPSAAQTIVEGDTIEGDTVVNQNIEIVQLPGESTDQLDRRLNKIAVSQVNAAASAT